MDYPLIQYFCDNCGESTEVMDCDEPLPKGWTFGNGIHSHYCPKCSKCKNKQIMMTKRDSAISVAAREYSNNRDNRASDAVDMSYLQNWYQDSIDETKEPIWTDKHLEELCNDFYLIPKK